MTNSRRKGHDFERANVRWFTDRGWKCRRRIQPRGGGGEPELEFDEYPLSDAHHECKRYARIAVYKWWEQAMADSGHRDPRLILKADNREELVVMSRRTYEEWARQLEDCYSHHQGESDE